jgi:hypothetical protein
MSMGNGNVDVYGQRKRMLELFTQIYQWQCIMIYNKHETDKEFIDNGLDKEDLYGDSDLNLYKGKFSSYKFGMTNLSETLSTAFGMYMRNGILENIGKSLLSGNGIRKTARDLGVSKCTVGKFQRILREFMLKSGRGDILCKCGQWVGHQGWCSYRYSKSEKRQKFMKKWHDK